MIDNRKQKLEPRRRARRRATAAAGSLIALAAVAGACRELPASTGVRATEAPAPSPSPASTEELLAEADRISGLEALIGQRRGETVVEGYFEGAGPDRLFHLRSATKSVTSLLVGIALDQGRLSSVDQTIGEILGSRVERFGPKKAALTVRDLLTMSAGLEWSEIGGVEEFNRWRVSRDPVGHYLERPIVAAPGEEWSYSSGASHLLSVILSAVTGRSARDYAAEVLFAPLEIESFRWERHNDGHTNGAAGLELRARDSLKIGQLVLGGGAWSGRRIVSEAWIDESTRTQIQAAGGGRYGYQWWIEHEGTLVIVSALGFAGQVISVVPKAEAIVVVHSRWRGLGRPSREQAEEVTRFIGRRLAPALVPEFAGAAAGS